MSTEMSWNSVSTCDAQVNCPSLLLFNDPRYSSHNVKTGQKYQRFDAFSCGKWQGSLAGVRQGSVFTSGFSAPFGGFDVENSRATTAALQDLVDDLLEQVWASGVYALRIRLRPCFYSENEQTLLFFLLNRGFEVEHAELNQHVCLQNIPGPDVYLAGLRPPARRAVRHGLATSYAFVEAATNEEWQAAYDLLAANRATKGRRLRFSFEYLRDMRDTFPRAIRMHVLSQHDRPVAAALVYRLLSCRDYVVAWGDALHDLKRSPMNLLAYHLIETALSQKILSLDLGISSLEGIPDTGLCRFKRSLGARSTVRFNVFRSL